MEILQEKIENFINSSLYSEKIETFKELETLRMKFINKFHESRILSLELDEYVVGKKDIIEGGDDTFCYWLETKLMGLGKIKGGSTAGNKFGIYYGKTKHDQEKKYRAINKWGSNYEEAFENIKHSIYELIQVGDSENYEEISENKLSPMFKGKILATYFPDKYLGIFSEEHINYFLYKLPISFEYEKTKTVELKKKLLLEFKEKNEFMRDWSNYIYMVFLYNYYSPKKKDEGDSDKVYSHIPKVEYVDFNYAGKIDSGKHSKEGRKKPDYEKEMRRKTQIGNLGENIVFNEEIKKLRKLGREDLAEKVKVVSEENDRLGYDILSFDGNGDELYIEVKSTVSRPSSIDFIITDNEYQQALIKENYFLYLVYEVEAKNPKIHILDKDMLKEEYMRPVVYRVGIKIDKLDQSQL